MAKYVHPVIKAIEPAHQLRSELDRHCEDRKTVTMRDVNHSGVDLQRRVMRLGLNVINTSTVGTVSNSLNMTHEVAQAPPTARVASV